MPGLPLVVRETNLGCSCSHPRTVEQMCRQDSRIHLSAEEAAAAEESLSVYCKPVELYNILQRRALRHPSFLQRCLHYKIQAKHKKRIQLTISLPAFVPDGVEPQNSFPLFVLLAAPVSEISLSEKSVNYRIIRACPITACSEFGKRDQTEASFILPEIRKLSIDAKSGNITILFVTFGELRNQSADGSISSFAFLSSKFGSLCHWAKLPLDFLSSSWEESASLHMGHRTEVLQTVDLHPSVLEFVLRGLSLKMLDDFVDVTKDEKQIMHLWNSFVRKQRVLADGHIPWACEAFSKLHGRDLVRIPALMWCWRLFMIKLWNHSLLDARTMNNCNLILEKFRDGNSDDQQS